MIGWIALAITAVVVASILLRIDDWGRDWSENTAVLSFDSKRTELHPLKLKAPVEELLGQLKEWADQRGNWTLVSSELLESPGDDGTVAVASLTRRTLLFRFVDDIEVRFVQSENDAPITFYAKSQSRIGKGDLGQNPRNLIELKTCFESDDK